MQVMGTQTAMASPVGDLATAGALPGPAADFDWRGTAIALPPGLAARAFGPAWVIALAVHFGVLALAFLAPAGGPAPAEPLLRMVFMEPPPPPPAPLGISGGGGSVPALVEPEAPPPVIEPKKEVPRPTADESKRLRRAEPAAKPKPRPRPEPRAVEPPAPVAAAEVAAGVSSGSIAGEAGGVVGGVAGGIAGGVVGGTGSEPVPVGRVAHPPVLVRRIAPVYPQQARRAGVEGLVLLEAILDRDGRVETGVNVIESVPMLDREAIAAVRKWRFRPARDASGESLRVILEIPIRFVLR